jgi:hypothetical protein
MAKKYSSYNVKITYTNGDTEDITLKGINTSDYKEMIKVYNDVKEDHKNDSCIIDFVGVNDSGELGILFTKEINTKTTDVDKIKMKTKDIVSNIEDLLKILKLKKEYHRKSQGLCDKEEDKLLHDIQFYKGDDLGKIKLFDKIQELRLERMDEKNELRFLSLFPSLDDTLKGIYEMTKKIDKIESGVGYSEETIKDYDIIREVTYKNDKERISLMSQLKPKYEKTVVDEANKKITFYNHGYTRKKNKKKVM